MNLHEEWYKEAKEMTLDHLSDFVHKLATQYSHDMNTIAHAMNAAALASMSAINKGPEGGLTQEQSKKVMGLFIRKWSNMSGPLKLTSWYGMMHPNNEPQFNSVPKEVWDDIQRQAQDLLKGDMTGDDPAVVAHLKSIAEGKVPFGYRVMQ
jgi:hypothetical protein